MSDKQFLTLPESPTSFEELIEDNSLYFAAKHQNLTNQQRLTSLFDKELAYFCDLIICFDNARILHLAYML